MDSKTYPEWEHPFSTNRCLCFKGRVSKFSFPFYAAQARLKSHGLAWTSSKTNYELGETRLTEAQFQIEAPDPYPLNKRRTDLGMLVVLSNFDSVTFIHDYAKWSILELIHHVCLLMRLNNLIAGKKANWTKRKFNGQVEIEWDWQ